MKKVDSKLLLGLVIGAAIGGAVAYLATSDKKEEWLDELGGLCSKCKDTLGDLVETAKSKYHKASEIVSETTEPTDC